jgi:hypothetical protein
MEDRILAFSRLWCRVSTRCSRPPIGYAMGYYAMGYKVCCSARVSVVRQQTIAPYACAEFAPQAVALARSLTAAAYGCRPCCPPSRQKIGYTQVVWQNLDT